MHGKERTEKKGKKRSVIASEAKQSGNYRVDREAIEKCYGTRLPRRLRLLAMTPFLMFLVTYK